MRGAVDGRPALLVPGTFGARADDAGENTDRHLVAPPINVLAPEGTEDRGVGRHPPPGG
ncbi:MULTISPECIES: hypothetical protein [unclassified Pseudofrankia]|uniref:hypothetical protein n=1 Tax=unclassified Pseudofrankia TaxID=2994372 RepID=UPI0012FF6AA0|nr:MULTISPECIES: hypothetical protein [unclassified Pseudofrankia]MDT3440226.1 hypothetical protein [Pseudofrankia sp. BMG5.37]